MLLHLRFGVYSDKRSSITSRSLDWYMATNTVNYCAESILRLEETSVPTVSTVSTCCVYCQYLLCVLSVHIVSTVNTYCV